MKGFFKSSIGKKLIMSISGLFLIVFLLVHLGLNSLLLFDSSGELFNTAANFMGTNPLMKVMEPMLALGFVLHIFYGVVLEIQNRMARGSSKYAKFDQSKSSKWASRNMIYLGVAILAFLVIHILNFLIPIKTGCDILKEVTINGVHMHDTYTQVTNLFEFWYYDLIYVIGAIALGMHLKHAFWSAFQTIGFSNDKWRVRLNVIGTIYAVIVAGGFAIIPIYFLIF